MRWRNKREILYRANAYRLLSGESFGDGKHCTKNTLVLRMLQITSS